MKAAGNLEEIAATQDLVAAERAFVRLEEELSRLKKAFRLAASDRMIEEAGGGSANPRCSPGLRTNFDS